MELILITNSFQMANEKRVVIIGIFHIPYCNVIIILNSDKNAKQREETPNEIARIINGINATKTD